VLCCIKFLALFGNWIDFNFKSSLDISVYIQCKPKDVQSLQSNCFLVFYHFGFETTILTFSRIIDFEDATNLFLKQVYSCAVVDACLIWTDLIILISRPVRWDKLDQSTHSKGKLHKLPINVYLGLIISPRQQKDCNSWVRFQVGSNQIS
jgi:hypothetical protein